MAMTIAAQNQALLLDRLPRASAPPCFLRGGSRLGRSFVAPTVRTSSLRSRSCVTAVSQLQMFVAEDFVLDESLGKVGFLLASTDLETRVDGLDMSKLTSQELVTGGVEAQLYSGRIQRGPRMNTKCILKAYPPRAVENGATADMMCANEFAMHASLQPPAVVELNPFLMKLLGGFVTSAGEQWLVFRNDGVITATAYCAAAAEAGANGRSIGEGEFGEGPQGPLRRRRSFALSILRRALGGLEYMHGMDVLHTSPRSPSNIFISTTEERDARWVRVKLGGLAFAVDASDEALSRADSPMNNVSKDLWVQAGRVGATTPRDRREFGKAEDVLQAGLLIATLSFLPFCTPGSITEASLHKLLEDTFRGPGGMRAMREYCAAEEAWEEAVAFLDAREGAGWELLGRMTAEDWRSRPTMSEVLEDPYLNMA